MTPNQKTEFDAAMLEMDSAIRDGDFTADYMDWEIADILNGFSPEIVWYVIQELGRDVDGPRSWKAVHKTNFKPEQLEELRTLWQVVQELARFAHIEQAKKAGAQ